MPRLFVFGLAVAFRNWPAAAVGLAATLCLAAAVLPRALGGAATAAPNETELRVLSSNIHRGTADPEALVALVDRFRPDILSVQELTPKFARKLRRAGLQRRLPQSVLSMRTGAGGAGLYSSLPLRQIAQPPSSPLAFRMPRAALRLRDGKRLRIVGVHPEPPTVDVQRWRSALESLPTAGAGSPWVLAGDFNATLDHAELRAVLDRGYTDGGDATGHGLEPTWPAGRTLPPLITIDHVLADRRLRFLEFDVVDLPGSDHNSVFAAIAVP